MGKIFFMLTCVIVDDEPKAIQGLSWELLNFKEEIKVVAAFNDPEKAIIYLAENNIDCLFLDIEMPTMDGFQFLTKLKSRDFAVIITTAYNEYALKALKNDAIDYLLKPIDTDDLEEAIKKIKKHQLKSLNSNTVENVLLNFNENTLILILIFLIFQYNYYSLVSVLLFINFLKLL